MNSKEVNVYFTNGDILKLKGELVEQMYKGLNSGQLNGVSLVSDSTNNITYNMANVIKLEWL